MRADTRGWRRPRMCWWRRRRRRRLRSIALPNHASRCTVRMATGHIVHVCSAERSLPLSVCRPCTRGANRLQPCAPSPAASSRRHAALTDAMGHPYQNVAASMLVRLPCTITVGHPATCVASGHRRHRALECRGARRRRSHTLCHPHPHSRRVGQRRRASATFHGDRATVSCVETQQAAETAS